jgi:hypothetical protein
LRYVKLPWLVQFFSCALKITKFPFLFVAFFFQPTRFPTDEPTLLPTRVPTDEVSVCMPDVCEALIILTMLKLIIDTVLLQPTISPTVLPTLNPTLSPTESPTRSPTLVSNSDE